MLRKDFVQFEIEKIGLIIARILGLKKEGIAQEAQELAHRTLSAEFGLEEADLNDLPVETFEEQLKTMAFSADKLDLLAQLIFESAHPFEDLDWVRNRLHKVLAIYHLLEHGHHTQSLTNLARREMIDRFLNNEQYG